MVQKFHLFVEDQGRGVWGKRTEVVWCPLTQAARLLSGTRFLGWKIGCTADSEDGAVMEQRALFLRVAEALDGHCKHSDLWIR